MKTTPVNITVAFGAFIALSVWLSHAVPVRSAPLMPPSPSTASLGTITGRVTKDDGTPVAGCSVVARSTLYVTPAPAGEAVTDADGQYRLRIDTSLSPSVFQNTLSAPSDTQFTVTVEGQEPLFLVPPAQTVTFPPTLTLQNINFRLTVGPQITIRVHDWLTGKPVPGVTVKYPGNPALNNDTRTGGVTDLQGQVVFRVPRLDVWLNLIPPGGDTPIIRAAPGSSFSRGITLSQVEDVVWDVGTEPTIPSTTPSVWHGVVLMADGHPAAGAKVSFLRADTETSAVTGAKGRFAISLPPETFEQYNDRFRGIAVMAEKGDQTTVFVPPIDAAWAGMTVRLARKPLASYSGTVIGPDGSPEAGVGVSCRGGLAIAPNSGDGVNRSTVTDAQGHFRLSGLPAGNYQVNFGGGLFSFATLPPSDPSYPYSNTLLTLGDGEQHDLGRLPVLPADEVLAGHILDNDGQPIPDSITAMVHGAHTNKRVDLDKEGQFRLYHIVQEPLTLDISRPHSEGSMQYNPEVFLKVPVQAGRQDVRVVLPAGVLPPPAVPVPALPPASAPPAVPAPVSVGPPKVSGGNGGQFVGGLLLVYYAWPPAPNPQQTNIHTLFQTQFWAQKGNTVWEGSLADMDGMQLRVAKNHGVLEDRAGHKLWEGPFSPEPVRAFYSVLTEKAKPNYITLQDPQRRTLWSGLAASHVPAVVLADGYVAVIGPSGRIIWQQAATADNVGFRTLIHGRQPGWVGSNLASQFSGVIHFAVAKRQAVFQTKDGRTLYSGPLSTLTLTATEDQKAPVPETDFTEMTQVILPFAVRNSHEDVTCTLYDAQGRKIPSTIISNGT